PGWVWIYPCYLWTPAGCVFVDGYWDYDVPRRGVLFAPMYFEARVRRPGWWFRPAYCVPDDVLLTALFVRTSWHQYFFGDYFEPRYEKLGYRAWIDYRVGGRFPDPLYAYEHWRHRDNPRWEQTLRTTYVGRREGTVPRPPRDLVQQQKTNVNVLVSVKQYKSPVYTMTPVSKTQLQQIRQTSEQLRVLSQK